MKLPLLLLSALAVAAQDLVASAVKTTDVPPGYLKVVNGRLVDADCKDFYFAGWNMWEVVELGACLQSLHPR